MTTALDALLACAGDWNGSNTLQDPLKGVESTTASTARVEPLMSGRFVRIDYTWTYDGVPQFGSMLVGHRPETDEATMYWIDSWHNGHSSMMCRGRRREDGVLEVHGSYGAGAGPDWGWRTEIHAAPEALRWVMYNVEPDGGESLAVEERLTRA